MPFVLKEFLLQIWPTVERIGPPVLGGAALLTFFSINFYWRTISEARRFDRHLQKHKSTKGFVERSFPWVSPLDAVAGFLPLSFLGKELPKYRSGREYLANIRSFRKVYAIVFPILIALTALGIAINEWVIDA